MKANAETTLGDDLYATKSNDRAIIGPLCFKIAKILSDDATNAKGTPLFSIN